MGKFLRRLSAGFAPSVSSSQEDRSVASRSQDRSVLSGSIASGSSGSRRPTRDQSRSSCDEDDDHSNSMASFYDNSVTSSVTSGSIYSRQSAPAYYRSSGGSIFGRRKRKKKLKRGRAGGYDEHSETSSLASNSVTSQSTSSVTAASSTASQHAQPKSASRFRRRSIFGSIAEEHNLNGSMHNIASELNSSFRSKKQLSIVAASESSKDLQEDATSQKKDSPAPRRRRSLFGSLKRSASSGDISIDVDHGSDGVPEPSLRRNRSSEHPQTTSPGRPPRRRKSLLNSMTPGDDRVPTFLSPVHQKTPRRRSWFGGAGDDVDAPPLHDAAPSVIDVVLAVSDAGTDEDANADGKVIGCPRRASLTRELSTNDIHVNEEDLTDHESYDHDEVFAASPMKPISVRRPFEPRKPAPVVDLNNDDDDDDDDDESKYGYENHAPKPISVRRPFESEIERVVRRGSAHGMAEPADRLSALERAVHRGSVLGSADSPPDEDLDSSQEIGPKRPERRGSALGRAMRRGSGLGQRSGSGRRGSLLGNRQGSAGSGLQKRRGSNYGRRGSAVQSSDDEGPLEKPASIHSITGRRHSMSSSMHQSYHHKISQLFEKSAVVHEYMAKSRHSNDSESDGSFEEDTEEKAKSEQQKSFRRHTLTTGSTFDDRQNQRHAAEVAMERKERKKKRKEKKNKSRLKIGFGRRRSSIAGSSTATKSLPSDIHGIVNRERIKRNLQPFSRNMVLDTIAKEVAGQLAASAGKKCTSSIVYHGNVGQGMTFENIHSTMMKDRKGTARRNILSPGFKEFGMALSKGSDGLLYLCQLFKS